MLARAFADATTAASASDPMWTAHIIWGNRRVGGGILMPSVNAWPPSTRWGADTTPQNAAIVIGKTFAGTMWAPGQWPPGGADSENVVWGSTCGGADCPGGTWATDDGDTVVWGTDDGDTVVWGTDDGDTVVWGTSCGAECDTPGPDR
jgi:hypothetical protein